MRIKDVLINLVQSIEEIADHNAMPDGSEGNASESFHIAGNIGRRYMDLARAVAGVFSGEHVKVICVKGAKADIGRIAEVICVQEFDAGGDKKTIDIAIMYIPERAHIDISEEEFVDKFRVIDESCRQTYKHLFSESAESVEAKRRKEADFLFENWSFPFEVKDSDGWNISGCDWHRHVYLEIPGRQDSVKVIFYIVFEMGSNKVIRKQATFAENQHIGTPSE